MPSAEPLDRPESQAGSGLSMVPSQSSSTWLPSTSKAPGFTIGNVHVMAGVPSVFHAMLESVKPGIQGGPRVLSWSLRCEIGEGDLAGVLGDVQEDFPDVSMGSYPFVGAAGYGSVLVLRSLLDVLRRVPVIDSPTRWVSRQNNEP